MAIGGSHGTSLQKLQGIHGFDAVHWSGIGFVAATDVSILLVVLLFFSVGKVIVSRRQNRPPPFNRHRRRQREANAMDGGDDDDDDAPDADPRTCSLTSCDDLRAFFCMPLREIREICGGGVALYLRFEQQLILLLLLLTSLGCGILLPVNMYYGSTHLEKGKHGVLDQFFLTTVESIPPASRVLWLHVAFTWIFALAMFHFYVSTFDSNETPRGQLESRTVLVKSGVPQHLVDEREMRGWLRRMLAEYTWKKEEASRGGGGWGRGGGVGGEHGGRRGTTNQASGTPTREQDNSGGNNTTATSGRSNAGKVQLIAAQMLLERVAVVKDLSLLAKLQNEKTAAVNKIERSRRIRESKRRHVGNLAHIAMIREENRRRRQSAAAVAPAAAAVEPLDAHRTITSTGITSFQGRGDDGCGDVAEEEGGSPAGEQLSCLVHIGCCHKAGGWTPCHPPEERFEVAARLRIRQIKREQLGLVQNNGEDKFHGTGKAFLAFSSPRGARRFVAEFAEFQHFVKEKAESEGRGGEHVFTTVTAALENSLTKSWTVALAPRVHDLNWPRLRLPTIRRMALLFSINLLIVLILVLFTTPTAVLSRLRRHHFDVEKYWASVIHAIASLGTALGGVGLNSDAIYAFMPGLLLLVINGALAWVLYAIGRYIEPWLTFSGAEKSIMRMTFFFYLFNSLLLPALSLTSVSDLLAMSRERDEGCSHDHPIGGALHAIAGAPSVNPDGHHSHGKLEWVDAGDGTVLEVEAAGHGQEGGGGETERSHVIAAAGEHLMKFGTDRLMCESAVLGNIFLRGSGAYFVIYILHRAHLTNAVGLLRLPERLYFCYLRGTAVTPAEKEQARKNWPFECGQHYSMLLEVLAICIVFSTTVPFILPCGLLFFVYKHYIDRYNLLYVWRTVVKSSTPVRYQAQHLVLIITLLHQGLMCGFLALRGTAWQFRACLFLPICSVGVIVQLYRERVHWWTPRRLGEGSNGDAEEEEEEGAEQRGEGSGLLWGASLLARSNIYRRRSAPSHHHPPSRSGGGGIGSAMGALQAGSVSESYDDPLLRAVKDDLRPLMLPSRDGQSRRWRQSSLSFLPPLRNIRSSGSSRKSTLSRGSTTYGSVASTEH